MTSGECDFEHNVLRGFREYKGYASVRTECIRIPIEEGNEGAREIQNYTNPPASGEWPIVSVEAGAYQRITGAGPATAIHHGQKLEFRGQELLCLDGDRPRIRGSEPTAYINVHILLLPRKDKSVRATSHGLLYLVYLISSRPKEMEPAIEELLTENLNLNFDRLLTCEWLGKAYEETVRRMPGQAHMFHFGSIKKQSATGCSEAIVNYLIAFNLRYWRWVVGENDSLLRCIDSATFDKLQGLMPPADGETIKKHFQKRIIFQSAPFNDEIRTEIKSKILKTRHMIPTLGTFNQHVGYLIKWAQCVKKLLDSTPRNMKLESTLKEIYKQDGQRLYEIQTSNNNWLSVDIPLNDRLEMSCRQLWLFLMRQHEWDKEKIENINIAHFAYVAQRVGFNSNTIRANSQNPNIPVPNPQGSRNVQSTGAVNNRNAKKQEADARSQLFLPVVETDVQLAIESTPLLKWVSVYHAFFVDGFSSNYPGEPTKPRLDVGLIEQRRRSTEGSPCASFSTPESNMMHEDLSTHDFLGENGSVSEDEAAYDLPRLQNNQVDGQTSTTSIAQLDLDEPPTAPPGAMSNDTSSPCIGTSVNYMAESPDLDHPAPSSSVGRTRVRDYGVQCDNQDLPPAKNVETRRIDLDRATPCGIPLPHSCQESMVGCDSSDLATDNYPLASQENRGDAVSGQSGSDPMTTSSPIEITKIVDRESGEGSIGSAKQGVAIDDGPRSTTITSESDDRSTVKTNSVGASNNQEHVPNHRLNQHSRSASSSCPSPGHARATSYSPGAGIPFSDPVTEHVECGIDGTGSNDQETRQDRISQGRQQNSTDKRATSVQNQPPEDDSPFDFAPEKADSPKASVYIPSTQKRMDQTPHQPSGDTIHHDDAVCVRVNPNDTQMATSQPRHSFTRVSNRNRKRKRDPKKFRPKKCRVISLARSGKPKKVLEPAKERHGFPMPTPNEWAATDAESRTPKAAFEDCQGPNNPETGVDTRLPATPQDPIEHTNQRQSNETSAVPRSEVEERVSLNEAPRATTAQQRTYHFPQSSESTPSEAINRIQPSNASKNEISQTRPGGARNAHSKNGLAPREPIHPEQREQISLLARSNGSTLAVNDQVFSQQTPGNDQRRESGQYSHPLDTEQIEEGPLAASDVHDVHSQDPQRTIFGENAIVVASGDGATQLSRSGSPTGVMDWSPTRQAPMEPEIHKGKHTGVALLASQISLIPTVEYQTPEWAEISANPMRFSSAAPEARRRGYSAWYQNQSGGSSAMAMSWCQGSQRSTQFGPQVELPYTVSQMSIPDTRFSTSSTRGSPQQVIQLADHERSNRPAISQKPDNMDNILRPIVSRTTPEDDHRVQVQGSAQDKVAEKAAIPATVLEPNMNQERVQGPEEAAGQSVSDAIPALPHLPSLTSSRRSTVGQVEVEGSQIPLVKHTTQEEQSDGVSSKTISEMSEGYIDNGNQYPGFDEGNPEMHQEFSEQGHVGRVSQQLPQRLPDQSSGSPLGQSNTLMEPGDRLLHNTPELHAAKEVLHGQSVQTPPKPLAGILGSKVRSCEQTVGMLYDNEASNEPHEITSEAHEPRVEEDRIQEHPLQRARSHSPAGSMPFPEPVQSSEERTDVSTATTEKEGGTTANGSRLLAMHPEVLQNNPCPDSSTQQYPASGPSGHVPCQPITHKRKRSLGALGHTSPETSQQQQLPKIPALSGSPASPQGGSCVSTVSGLGQDAEDAVLTSRRSATTSSTATQPAAGLGTQNVVAEFVSHEIDTEVASEEIYAEADAEVMEVEPGTKPMDTETKMEERRVEAERNVMHTELEAVEGEVGSAMDLDPERAAMDLDPEREPKDTEPETETMDLDPQTEAMDLDPETETMDTVLETREMNYKDLNKLARRIEAKARKLKENPFVFVSLSGRRKPSIRYLGLPKMKEQIADLNTKGRRVIFYNVFWRIINFRHASFLGALPRQMVVIADQGPERSDSDKYFISETILGSIEWKLRTRSGYTKTKRQPKVTKTRLLFEAPTKRSSRRPKGLSAQSEGKKGMKAPNQHGLVTKLPKAPPGILEIRTAPISPRYEAAATHFHTEEQSQATSVAVVEGEVHDRQKSPTEQTMLEVPVDSVAQIQNMHPEREPVVGNESDVLISGTITGEGNRASQTHGPLETIGVVESREPIISRPHQPDEGSSHLKESLPHLPENSQHEDARSYLPRERDTHSVCVSNQDGQPRSSTAALLLDQSATEQATIETGIGDEIQNDEHAFQTPPKPLPGILGFQVQLGDQPVVPPHNDECLKGRQAVTVEAHESRVKENATQAYPSQEEMQGGTIPFVDAVLPALGHNTGNVADVPTERFTAATGEDDTVPIGSTHLVMHPDGSDNNLSSGSSTQQCSTNGLSHQEPYEPVSRKRKRSPEPSWRTGSATSPGKKVRKGPILWGIPPPEEESVVSTAAGSGPNAGDLGLNTPISVTIPSSTKRSPARSGAQALRGELATEQLDTELGTEAMDTEIEREERDPEPETEAMDAEPEADVMDTELGTEAMDTEIGREERDPEPEPEAIDAELETEAMDFELARQETKYGDLNKLAYRIEAKVRKLKENPFVFVSLSHRREPSIRYLGLPKMKEQIADLNTKGRRVIFYNVFWRIINFRHASFLGALPRQMVVIADQGPERSDSDKYFISETILGSIEWKLRTRSGYTKTKRQRSGRRRN